MQIVEALLILVRCDYIRTSDHKNLKKIDGIRWPAFSVFDYFVFNQDTRGRYVTDKYQLLSLMATK
jgi:hypothetical protein